MQLDLRPFSANFRLVARFLLLEKKRLINVVNPSKLDNTPSPMKPSMGPKNHTQVVVVYYLPPPFGLRQLWVGCLDGKGYPLVIKHGFLKNFPLKYDFPLKPSFIWPVFPIEPLSECQMSNCQAWLFLDWFVAVWDDQGLFFRGGDWWWMILNDLWIPTYSQPLSM